MRKRARESICPGDHCESSKSGAIEHGMTSLDESWFYLSTDYEFVWLPRDEKFPKENDTQFNQKFILMIVWNPRGFHLIKVLEKVASSMPAIIGGKKVLKENDT
jgi:hypothetical protein